MADDLQKADMRVRLAGIATLILGILVAIRVLANLLVSQEETLGFFSASNIVIPSIYALLLIGSGIGILRGNLAYLALALAMVGLDIILIIIAAYLSPSIWFLVPLIVKGGLLVLLVLVLAAAGMVQTLMSLRQFMLVVDKTNVFLGKLNVFITLLAVFVITFEVVLRYVFHRPTNWAHEYMTLLFGIQYFMAAGYAHYHRAHVRVDVFYSTRKRRTRAFLDLFTAVFFFLFNAVLLWTCWTFYWSSQTMLGGGTILGITIPGELSLTDWAPPFYPVKFMMPFGAFMLLLQGIVWLIRDIHVAVTGEEMAS